MYNSRILTVEGAIHVKFYDNKSNTTMSELDESFAEMKIENMAKSSIASCQDKPASNTLVDDHPEEVREPTGRLPERETSKKFL